MVRTHLESSRSAILRLPELIRIPFRTDFHMVDADGSMACPLILFFRLVERYVALDCFHFDAHNSEKRIEYTV